MPVEGADASDAEDGPDDKDDSAEDDASKEEQPILNENTGNPDDTAAEEAPESKKRKLAEITKDSNAPESQSGEDDLADKRPKQSAEDSVAAGSEEPGEPGESVEAE